MKRKEQPSRQFGIRLDDELRNELEAAVMRLHKAGRKEVKSSGLARALIRDGLRRYAGTKMMKVVI